MSAVPTLVTITAMVVRFRDTRSGRAELRVAARMARVLGFPLGVYSATADLELAPSEVARVTERVREIVGNHLEIHMQREGARGDRAALPPSTLIVDGEYARAVRGGTALALGDSEFRIDDPHAPIFVPIGDGETGIHAARTASELAARLGKSIVFYHTSWRNPECASPDPQEHACAAAATVLRVAKLSATVHRVPHQTIVELAPDVTGGIVRAALRASASCIVVARGGKTGKGSYVDQLLDQSPIPILIIGNDSEVRP